MAFRAWFRAFVRAGQFRILGAIPTRIKKINCVFFLRPSTVPVELLYILLTGTSGQNRTNARNQLTSELLFTAGQLQRFPRVLASVMVVH
jgi:hypothetical protein